MDSPNFLAVLVAAASAFVIGGLWYSPLLFRGAWMTVNNLTETQLDSGGQGKIFSMAFIFALLMAFNLAMFLNTADTTVAWGAAAGGLAAVWVALGIATVALFERRPPAYVAINGGYWVVALVVMGGILGAWR